MAALMSSATQPQFGSTDGLRMRRGERPMIAQLSVWRDARVHDRRHPVETEKRAAHRWSVPPALVGRKRECQALEKLLDDVRDGQSRVLVLRGELGIGKTALLNHLIGAAHDFTVVQATGVKSEMELPFAALHQLCAPMLDRLAELPEPQSIAASTAFGSRVGLPPDRLLIGLAVLNLLTAGSASGPLLCIIDDEQWLDNESAQALAFVARRLLADRVALVFATSAATDDLARFPELLIEGLIDGEAQRLLDSVLHAPLDQRVRDRIVAESGGNPLALIDWPPRVHPAEPADGFTAPNDGSRTSEIDAAFRQRVAELPTSARRLLTLAAAEPTGDPFVFWRAADMLGLAPLDATTAVDAGLISIGVRVSFRHPSVRKASYGAGPLCERQAAHRALAEATDPDVDPDLRAWHRALGSPGPDDEIAEALDRAASRARARGGFPATAALLERSVALSATPKHRADRMLAAASAHLETGSLERAGCLLAAAEDCPLDDMDRAQLDMLRARQAILRNDLAAGAALHERAAQRLESLDLDLAFAAYLEAMGAAAMAGPGDGVRMSRVAAAAIACPRSAEPTGFESLAVGLAKTIIDGPRDAAPALRKALSAPHDRLGADAFHWLGYMAAGAASLWDFDGLVSLATTRVTLARTAGALSALPNALDALARVFLFEGDLDSAASAVSEAMEILGTTGRDFLICTTAHHAALEAGDDAAQRIDEQINTARDDGAGRSLRTALWARATLANGRGEYADALAASSEAIELPSAWSELSLHEHVEAAVRAGQRDIATTTLDRLIRSTAASGTDWALGVQRRSQALLADDADADDLYREAIEHLSRTRLRLDLARAHLLYGEWLRRSNRRVDARAELQAAYDMFVSMGIRAFAERCRHELLITGATVRKRTVASYDELTSQELQVSRLAVEGLSNAQIGARLYISVRTVEWHLRKVFTKLGISTRRELKNTLPRHVPSANLNAR